MGRIAAMPENVPGALGSASAEVAQGIHEQYAGVVGPRFR
jgi:hypothetical protein